MQRSTTGFSTVDANDPMVELPFLDPTTWAIYMNDMNVLPTTLGWTNTNTNGTLAVAQGTTGTGIATQTLGGADNDLSQLYMTTGTFALVASKKAYFEAKVKVDKGAAGTIGQQELFIGLCTVQTAADFVAADGLSWAVDNAVGFGSFDGSTNLDAVIRKADAESIQDAAGTYADATEYVLSWYFNGSNVTFYIDDAMVGQFFAYPTGVMTVCLYIKGGEAKPAVLTTDYVLVAVER